MIKSALLRVLRLLSLSPGDCPEGPLGMHMPAGPDGRCPDCGVRVVRRRRAEGSGPPPEVDLWGSDHRAEGADHD